MKYKYFGTKKKFRSRESIINADSRYYKNYQIHKINDIECEITRQNRFQENIGNKSLTETKLLIIMVGAVCILGNYNELINFANYFVKP